MSAGRRRRLVAAALGVVAGARCVSAWETIVPSHYRLGDRTVEAFAVDSAGDAFVASFLDGVYPDTTVTKLAGATGAVAWRRPLPDLVGVAHEFALHGLQADAAPDLVFTAVSPPPSLAFRVGKVDGADGRVRWIRPVDFYPAALAIAPGDDVLVGGAIDDRLAVTRLSGATGDVVWTHRDDGPTASRAGVLLVDRSGAVVAVGASGGSPLAVKLAGTDGAVRWRSQPATTGGVVDAVLDGDANVVVGIRDANGLACIRLISLAAADGVLRWDVVAGAPPQGTVTAVSATPPGAIFVLATRSDPASAAIVGFQLGRFDAATGAEHWRRDVPIGYVAPPIGIAPGLVAAGSPADAFVSGQVSGGRRCADLAVLRVAGDTGDTRWLEVQDGSVRAPYCNQSPDDMFFPPPPSGEDADAAAAIAATPDGTVLFAGQLSNRRGRSHQDTVVGSLRDALAGRRLRIRRRGTSIATTLDIRDPQLFPPGAHADDRPTRAGLEVLIGDATAPALALSLPARGWRRKPTTPVWTYADATCRARLAAGTLLLRCHRPATTTVPTSPRPLPVTVRFPGGRQWCLVFGGTIARDNPSAFDAHDAAPPATCRWTPAADLRMMGR